MAHKGVEVEVKLRVSNAAAVRRALAKLGFALVRREWERDIVLDTPGLELRATRRLLRLRRHGPHWQLTFKGPPEEDAAYKIRPEFETALADGGRLLQILDGLGYRPVFRYEKRRSTYRKRREGAVVSLDVTPIGTYLELEGPRAWIDRTARALGYSAGDYITLSYAQLYLQHCREEGLQPTDMVFRR